MYTYLFICTQASLQAAHPFVLQEEPPEPLDRLDELRGEALRSAAEAESFGTGLTSVKMPVWIQNVYIHICMHVRFYMHAFSVYSQQTSFCSVASSFVCFRSVTCSWDSKLPPPV